MREQNDEQKESYFLLAKKRLQERDYQGATEYFERALDVNPRSASAHFELGILYEQQQNDYTSALYHYQKTLTLRPDFPAADIIKQHMEQCKRELAKSVVQLPTLEGLQREVDTLRAQNRDLKRQVEAWQNYYAGRGVTWSNLLHAATNPVAAPTQQVTAVRANNAGSTGTGTGTASPRLATPSLRSHTVVSGETLSSIAQRYGVRLSALQAANPNVDARRMRPGQTLVIPASSP